MTRPAYKSETYYRVVIGTGLYHGWRCIWAGDGTLKFRHEDGTEKSFHARGMAWTASAWHDFVTMASNYTTKEPT